MACQVPALWQPTEAAIPPQAKRERDKRYDERRTAEQPWRRWYWTQRWRNIAKAQLRDEPLCAMCLAQGKVTPATVCDHVEAHKGDPHKFWFGKRQSLCAPHHSRDKQEIENGRIIIVIGEDGWPVRG